MANRKRNKKRTFKSPSHNKTEGENPKPVEEEKKAYKHEIKMVLQAAKDQDYEAAQVGFVYTCGLYKSGGETKKNENSDNKAKTRPEFLVRNVPKEKMCPVAQVLNFLSEREVEHGDTVSSQRLQLKAVAITDNNQRQELLNKYLCACKKHTEVIELVPRFEHPDNKERWGMYPEAPECRDLLVERIMACKLPEKTVRYVVQDDNPKDLYVEWVSVQEALQHSNDWTTDVYKSMTKEEETYVKKNIDYFLGILE